jgi:tRNA G18 (ribose-2'-O)-methylase SpoU
MQVEKIWLCGYTGTPPRKEITKTAIGAEEMVDWESVQNPLDAIKKLKEEGWQIVALELTPDAVELADFSPSDKVCLVVGHELSGVTEETLAECDAVIKIPMLGKKESLNVAVAAGIALYALRHA